MSTKALRGAEIACCQSAGLVIKRVRVRIPAGASGEFSSPELILCADSYSASVLPRVTAVASKRPRSFCQKGRWQVAPKHAYPFDPTKSEWADYAAVRAQCGNLSGNELTRNLSENLRLQSSQLAEPLWTDYGINSEISVREPIPSPKKIKGKKVKAENEWSNILPKFSQSRKEPSPPPPYRTTKSVSCANNIT